MTALESLNRARSVADLVAVIWHNAPARHEDADLPYETSTRNEQWWADAARIAGHRPPSEPTRELVVEALCRRVQEAREGRPDRCIGDDIECQDGRNYWPAGAGYVERDCPICAGSGHAPCANCGDPDSPGVVVLPLGLFCWTCAEDDHYGHPALARHARLIDAASQAVAAQQDRGRNARRARRRLARAEQHAPVHAG